VGISFLKKKRFSPFERRFPVFCYEISATALAGRLCVTRGTRDTKFRLSKCLFPLCISLLCGYTWEMRGTVESCVEIRKVGRIVEIDIFLKYGWIFGRKWDNAGFRKLLEGFVWWIRYVNRNWYPNHVFGYQFPVCNKKWLKNGKLRNAILSAFYISQRNFGILLILWCSFKLWCIFCLDLSRSKF
jgi:hypothetical protein